MTNNINPGNPAQNNPKAQNFGNNDKYNLKDKDKDKDKDKEKDLAAKDETSRDVKTDKGSC